MRNKSMLVSFIALFSISIGVSVAALPKETTPKIEPLKSTVIVKSPQASLLSKPQARASRVETLTKLAPVKVISKSGNYTQVETASGKKGYVENRHLAKNPFVSVDSKKAINIRSGPGANDTILFTLQNTYPLAVIEKKGNRVRVVDYEGDAGWVHENLLSTKAYAIVNQKSINLRDQPGADSLGKPIGKALFTAPRGVVFEVVESDPKSGWLHLRHADGDEGWCSPRIVWGWLSE